MNTLLRRCISKTHLLLLVLLFWGQIISLTFFGPISLLQMDSYELKMPMSYPSFCDLLILLRPAIGRWKPHCGAIYNFSVFVLIFHWVECLYSNLSLKIGFNLSSKLQKHLQTIPRFAIYLLLSCSLTSKEMFSEF